MLRTLARLGQAALLAGGGLALATPAHAAGCSSSEVTVVVDFGGSAQVRCVGGDPATAGGAIEQAGFSVIRVETQPGAICKINSAPSDIGCRMMPPSDNYWSFHYASAGGSWTYSSKGFYAYDPAPGTVVGASLGSGGAPGIAPPATTAPAPTSTPPPATSTSRPTSSTTAPGTSDSTARSTSGGSTTGSSDSDSSGNASSTSGGASTAPGSTSDATDPKSTKTTTKDEKAKDAKSSSRSSTSSASSSSTDDATAAAADGNDRTPPEGTIGGNAFVPVLVGSGLLTALGGGAVVMARRRAD